MINLYVENIKWVEFFYYLYLFLLDLWKMFFEMVVDYLLIDLKFLILVGC